MELLSYLLPALFFISILVQCVFLLGVFPTLLRHVNFDLPETNKNQPGVSILVAALNELENLKELIPLLESQNYPNFEIIIIDDRSEDGTYDFLLNNESAFKKVKFVRILALPEHYTAKKYAITMGIKKASYDLILLTDADCRPTSNNWINSMVTQLTSEKEVVLGWSPYYKYPGFVNTFIRYETFQTALQFFSFATAGVPFMGLGRNLMYSKQLFWKNNGFANHKNLLSGDDDLFVNAVANKNNIEIRTDEPSFMMSEPKHTFKEWMTQKRRHLSVGKKYKTRDRINLGLLWLSFIGAWLLFIPNLVFDPSWFSLSQWLVVPKDFLARVGIQHWEPFTNWKKVVLITFIMWQLIRWLVLHKLNVKLSRTVKSSKLLFYDFAYLGYLLVFGVMTMYSNPKKIKWK